MKIIEFKKVVNKLGKRQIKKGKEKRGREKEEGKGGGGGKF